MLRMRGREILSSTIVMVTIQDEMQPMHTKQYDVFSTRARATIVHNT